jgi:hypothetical protein
MPIENECMARLKCMGDALVPIYAKSMSPGQREQHRIERIPDPFRRQP